MTIYRKVREIHEMRRNVNGHVDGSKFHYVLSGKKDGRTLIKAKDNTAGNPLTIKVSPCYYVRNIRE